MPLDRYSSQCCTTEQTTKYIHLDRYLSRRTVSICGKKAYSPQCRTTEQTTKVTTMVLTVYICVGGQWGQWESARGLARHLWWPGMRPKRTVTKEIEMTRKQSRDITGIGAAGPLLLQHLLI